ncbi:MAG TPA: HAD family hydrolase [Blastocatellia bacterium]|nr:HAD family hydrolase [Blastocatellia bacterium]
MRIKAISFDFWHTLFTEQPGAFRLYQHRRGSLLAKLLPEHCSRLDSDLARACSIEAENHHRIWKEEHRTLSASERVSAILNHLDVAVSEPVLATIVARFEEGILEHPPVLVDGAREALSELARHYRLGIISDVGFSPGRVLKQVLSDNGLLEVFDSLVFSDEAGRAKPHIEVFERTARALSAEPGAMVHVGDLERTDIAGARQAGYRAIRFVGVTPMEEGETTSADFITDDLTEIPRLIERLNGGLE